MLAIVVLGFFTFQETLYVRENASPEYVNEKDIKAVTEMTTSLAEKQTDYNYKGICPKWYLPYDPDYLKVHPAGFWLSVWRFVPLLLSPLTWFTVATFGMLQVWVVIASSSVSQVFAAPPYLFDATQCGLLSVASLVGALLAFIVFGPALDFWIKYSAKRNNGIFEPEFRLPPMIISTLTVCFGFVGYGTSLYRGDHWMAPAFCLGLITFGQTIGCAIAMSYITDATCDRSPESWACISVIRNVIAFAFLWFVSDWLEAQDTQRVFSTIGGLSAACSLTFIPMYIYGKRARSWCYRRGYITFDERLKADAENRLTQSISASVDSVQEGKKV